MIRFLHSGWLLFGILFGNRILSKPAPPPPTNLQLSPGRHQFDKKTIITISQPVAVEGTILPAGQYVLTLLNFMSPGNVVCIFNGEGTRLITTVQAIHAQRLQPTDQSEFSFYDPTAGQPAVLHTWFYPGDYSGF